MGCEKFSAGSKAPVDPRPKCSNKSCGLPSNCAVEAGKGTCWCFQYPNLENPKYSGECMCESCLKKALKEQDLL